MEQANLPVAITNALQPYLEQGGAGLAATGPKQDIGDLELSLHRRSGNLYSIETRFTPPGSATEIRLGSGSPVEVDLNEEILDEHATGLDWKGYGAALSSALFSAESLKLAFAQAVARAAVLRLRLLCGPSAPELQRLYWETLINPLDGSALSADQNILFSRYLASAGAREIQLRPRTDLKALVAVANPLDLDEYNLAPVNVSGELERARQSLGGLQAEYLPGGGKQCTLPEFVGRLQKGRDVVYLVAHGALQRGQAWLWFEGEDGNTQRISGTELAAQVRLLDFPPRLIVLASCESAGKGTGAALSALGPLLCEAGVPAVIAMQGKVSMDSLERCMPIFFQQLLRDGLVDRALAAARSTLLAAGAPDYWMPVLYMQLKDGLLWRTQEISAPQPIIKLWGLIQTKFAEKAAAQEAVQDLVSDPADPDYRQAFALQLKKAISVDPQFGSQLEGLLQQIQPAKSSPGIVIQVGGNVGGNIVIGNNNKIEN